MSSMWMFRVRVRQSSQQPGDVAFGRTMHMTDVNGQIEQGMSHSLVEAGETFERVDEHARLRLEGQGHVGPLGETEHGLQGLGEPGQALILLDGHRRASGPE